MDGLIEEREVSDGIDGPLDDFAYSFVLLFLWLAVSIWVWVCIANSP